MKILLILHGFYRVEIPVHAYKLFYIEGGKNMALKFYEMSKIKREALGLTQAEFGEKAGVTGSTISKFEQGEFTTDLVTNAIKYAFGQIEQKLTPDELGAYKLRVAVESLIGETDDDNRIMKLNTVVFAATKWQDEILKKKRFNK
jgi:transcriptional regulator with XRE-family HTH domain